MSRIKIPRSMGVLSLNITTMIEFNITTGRRYVATKEF
jgi:hypothetical protein